MEDKLEILKKFLPPEVIESLQLSSFSPGEMILSANENKIFYIQKGFVHAVSHYEKREYLLPFRLKPGDIAGVNTYSLYRDKWWEFRAVTDVEGFFLSHEVLNNYVCNNLDSYKALMQFAASITEKVALCLYIQVHGGAKSLLAYGLVEYSTNNEFEYQKHENIAKALNISRARLYKIEEEFTKKRLIRKERKKIIILNRKRLKDYYREFLFM